MNILPNSKWIECKKTEEFIVSDPKNPWDGLVYSPRPKGKETQFQPIENTNGLPMFRKEFTAKKEQSVKITATSLGIYNIWCNGRRVGFKDTSGETVYDEFNPGATVYSKRVMATEYDLSDYVIDGENVILAVVAPGWWRGTIFYDSFGQGLGMAFCAEIDVDGSKIVTDESWQVMWGGRVRAADIYHGELYNAALTSYEEISTRDYSHSEWKTPSVWNDTVIENFKADHFPQRSTHINDLEIVPFAGPAVRIRKHLSRKPQTVTVYNGIKDNGSDFGEINVVRELSATDSFTLKKGETAVIDFGQNLVALPDVIFKTEKGSYIQIRVAEMLNDSGLLSRGNDNPKGSLYTINYRGAKSKAYYIANGCESGEHYRPMFTFFGFRYLDITATEDIEVKDLAALVVGSEIEEVGSFETSNKEVNQLISNILWGQRGNYLSIPTDCPQRDERQGWTGDTQFFCNTAAYNANVLDFFHKWLTDARDSQHDNGAYHQVIPMVRVWRGDGVAWADAPIIVTHVMWRMYADISIIQENIDSLDKYMDHLATKEMQGPAPIHGDWLAYVPTDMNYICKAYYAWDAQIMAELHAVLGNTEKSKEYSDLYDRIKECFRENYLDADGNILEKYRTQTGYLLALHTDMLNGDEISRAADALEQTIIDNGYKLSTGFIGTAILCKTLAKVGKNGIAYSLLLQTDDPSWIYSIHQGATTIWERWNSYTVKDGFGDVNMNSFNHYSFGAVMEWMYRYVAGIEVDAKAPGFEHLILQPKPDMRADGEIPEGQERITWAKGTYNCRYGLISSEWKRDGDRFNYCFETPVAATLYLPVAEGKNNLLLNGEEISIDILKLHNDCAIIELPVGKHTVKY